MGRRRPRIVRHVGLAAALVALAAPAPAFAFPWDAGGAIPPSATPAPARPDPLCTESYANDRRRSDRAYGSVWGLAWPGRPAAAR